MTDRMNLNMEDLEMVNGGDQSETNYIALLLALRFHSLRGRTESLCR